MGIWSVPLQTPNIVEPAWVLATTSAQSTIRSRRTCTGCPGKLDSTPEAAGTGAANIAAAGFCTPPYIQPTSEPEDPLHKYLRARGMGTTSPALQRNSSRE